MVVQWHCIGIRLKKSDEKEKDGGDRRRGSGHHSLSQLTQPSGVGSVCPALLLSVSAPPRPLRLTHSRFPCLFLCRDRRRRISFRINHGSSFHCRAGDTDRDTRHFWKGPELDALEKVDFKSQKCVSVRYYPTAIPFKATVNLLGSL